MASPISAGAGGAGKREASRRCRPRHEYALHSPERDDGEQATEVLPVIDRLEQDEDVQHVVHPP